MSPICFGCHVNNSWNPNPVPIQPTAPFDSLPPMSIEWGEPPTAGMMPIYNLDFDLESKQENGLTDEELQVLYHLREAWNAFSRLEKHREMDKTEFLDSIHKTQQIIALRVARRVNPKIWIQPE